MIYIIGMPTKLVPGTSLFVTIFVTGFVTIGNAPGDETIGIRTGVDTIGNSNCCDAVGVTGVSFSARDGKIGRYAHFSNLGK